MTSPTTDDFIRGLLEEEARALTEELGPSGNLEDHIVAALSHPGPGPGGGSAAGAGTVVASAVVVTGLVLGIVAAAGQLNEPLAPMSDQNPPASLVAPRPLLPPIADPAPTSIDGPRTHPPTRVAAAPGSPSPVPTTAPPAAPDSSGSLAQQLADYDEAAAMLQQKNFGEAAAAFNAFVRRHPSSDLIPEAEMSRLEALARGRQHVEAAALAAQLAARPRQPRRAEILRVHADSLLELGRCDDARASYLDAIEAGLQGLSRSAVDQATALCQKNPAD